MGLKILCMKIGSACNATAKGVVYVLKHTLVAATVPFVSFKKICSFYKEKIARDYRSSRFYAITDEDRNILTTRYHITVPFYWLQTLSQACLCFNIVNISHYLFIPSYAANISLIFGPLTIIGITAVCLLIDSSVESSLGLYEQCCLEIQRCFLGRDLPIENLPFYQRFLRVSPNTVYNIYRDYREDFSDRILEDARSPENLSDGLIERMIELKNHSDQMQPELKQPETENSPSSQELILPILPVLPAFQSLQSLQLSNSVTDPSSSNIELPKDQQQELSITKQ